MLNALFSSPVHTDGMCMLMLQLTCEGNRQSCQETLTEKHHIKHLFSCTDKVEGLNHVCMNHELLCNTNMLLNGECVRI